MKDEFDKFLHSIESEESRREAKAIQLEADKICDMILSGEYQEVDIQIAMNKLKEKVEKSFPDKKQLYEMIYESRFKRFRDQFGS